MHTSILVEHTIQLHNYFLETITRTVEAKDEITLLSMNTSIPITRHIWVITAEPNNVIVINMSMQDKKFRHSLMTHNTYNITVIYH